MNQTTNFTYFPIHEVVRVCDSEDEELSFGDRMKTPFSIFASTLKSTLPEIKEHYFHESGLATHTNLGVVR